MSQSTPPDRHWTVWREGAELAVREWGRHGSGPSYVLVHGYPDDQRIFEPLIAALGTDAHVVTYDTRGAGSTRLERGASVRLPALAADLHAVLESAAIEAPVVLLGHDWGSVQCWEAVGEAWAASRIGAYVSVSGPSLDHLRHLLALAVRRDGERRREVLAQLATSWYALGFGTPITRPVAVRLYLRRFARALAPQYVDTEARGRLHANARRGARLYAANVARRLLARRARRHTCVVPATVVHLDDDPFLRPVVLERLGDTVADLTVTHRTGGHWWVHARPEEAAALLREVAARVAAPST